MALDFIPKKEIVFYDWQRLLMDYLAIHYLNWGVPQETWENLLNLQTDYTHKYAAADNPITRTPVAVVARQEARKDFVNLLRQVIRAFVTYNPTVTDEDRKKMELPIHKQTKTHAPIADSYPEFEIDTRLIRRLTIHYHNQKSKSKQKPQGQHAAEIAWVISNSQIINTKDLINSTISTKSPCTLEFTGDQRGKTVYFCLRWENTRGEKGPWSEIVSAIVP
jgi:hypothetical protein